MTGALASLRRRLTPPRPVSHSPAAPGAPISTSAPREAPVKSPSERPALGSGTEGLCSPQPRGQRVIINRGPVLPPTGSTILEPARGKSRAPAPHTGMGTRGRAPWGGGRSPRRCFPSRALCPHPAADPNAIPGGKGRHGAHRHRSEARHGTSAGLGICWRHNEHLCALKRLRPGPGRAGGGAAAPCGLSTSRLPLPVPQRLLGRPAGSGRGPHPRAADPQHSAGTVARDGAAPLRCGRKRNHRGRFRKGGREGGAAIPGSRGCAVGR